MPWDIEEWRKLKDKRKSRGILVSTGPDQPIVTDTENPWEIYEHVQRGGRAFVSFKDWDYGYDIHDRVKGEWVTIMANAFTMSPDHVQNLEIHPDGTMEMDAFFRKEMCPHGTIIGVEPSSMCRVRLRIKPERIEYAHLIVGRVKGMRGRLR